MKFFLLLLFIVACSKTETQPPSWFIKTKENTDNTLYGYGSGNTKSSAEYVALSNLKERIYTSVSSQTFMQDISVNGKTENEYSHTIKTQMPTIVIPAYNASQIHSSNNETFVEIEVNKQKLADSILTDLIKSNDKISPVLQEYLSTTDNIKKIKLINDLKQKCDVHLELEHFYNGMGYVMPNRICPQVIKLQYNFKVENSLQITNTHPIIEEMLINLFSTKFTVLKSSANVVSYKTNIKTQKVENSFIAGVEIKIMQNGTKEVYKKNCTGSSSVSKEKATENAFNSCLAQSKNIIFEEFFNIK